MIYRVKTNIKTGSSIYLEIFLWSCCSWLYLYSVLTEFFCKHSVCYFNISLCEKHFLVKSAVSLKLAKCSVSVLTHSY